MSNAIQSSLTNTIQQSSHYHSASYYMVHMHNGIHSGVNKALTPCWAYLLHKASASASQCKTWFEGMDPRLFWPPTHTSMPGDASDASAMYQD